MLEQQLIVGKTYRFTFKPEFERHGVCSTPGVTCLHKGGGVFTVKQITTFADLARAQNGDIFGTFFEPLGFTQGEMNKYFSGKPDTEYEPETVVRKVESNRTVVTSSAGGGVVFKTTATAREELVETGRSLAKKRYNASLNFANFPIYKLVDVVDGERDALYAPELAIANVPEVGIKEYRNVSVAIDIGYWDKPEQMDCILTRIRQDLLLYGIPPLDINLVAVDTKWMNKAEYDSLTKIRVPGQPVVITDDNKKLYIGKTAIVGGTTKTIIDPAPSHVLNTATEVDINSIIKKKQSIDQGMLLTSALKSVEEPFEGSTRTVFLDDVYESNVQYLEDLGDGVYKYLVAGEDFEIGNPIKGFVEKAAGTFIDLGPKYRVAGDSDKDRGDLKYVQSTYTSAGGETYIEGKDYYKFESGEYIAHTGWTAGETIPEGIFVLTSTAYVDATQEIKDEGKVVLYVLESAHQFVEDASSSATKYSKTNIVKVDYAEAADLVGKQFTFTPVGGGALMTLELTAEDIASFTTLIGNRVNIANEVASRKYAGCWFVYYDEGVGGTLATRIKEDSHTTLSGKPGAICGITGEISVETFIEDKDLIKYRNYYQQYLETKRLYDAEVEKNARLVEGQIALSNRIAELTARVHELEG